MLILSCNSWHWQEEMQTWRASSLGFGCSQCSPSLSPVFCGLAWRIITFCWGGPCACWACCHPRHGFGCAIFPGQIHFFSKGSTAFPVSCYWVRSGFGEPGGSSYRTWPINLRNRNIALLINTRAFLLSCILCVYRVTTSIFPDTHPGLGPCYFPWSSAYYFLVIKFFFTTEVYEVLILCQIEWLIT